MCRTALRVASRISATPGISPGTHRAKRNHTRLTWLDTRRGIVLVAGDRCCEVRRLDVGPVLDHRQSHAHLHRRLDRGPGDLCGRKREHGIAGGTGGQMTEGDGVKGRTAVALRRVAVADREERAGGRDGQAQHRAAREVARVEVAAGRVRRDRRVRAVARGRDAHLAREGRERDLDAARGVEPGEARAGRGVLLELPDLGVGPGWSEAYCPAALQ
jgi:hypothetical protein